MIILPSNLFKASRKNFSKNTSRNNIFEKGQALLVILLIMAVVLTVLMSISSKTVTEVKVTGLEEDSLRAFSAAEAGVEEKLLNPSLGTFGGTMPGDTSVNYTGSVTNPPETDRRFKYPRDLKAGETATFWLVSHNATSDQLTCSAGAPCFSNNQIRFCWGKSPEAPGPTKPAIEILLFYDDGVPPSASIGTPNNFSNLKVARYAYDPNETRINGFDKDVIKPPPATTCTLDGKDFLYESKWKVAAPLDLCKNNDGCIIMAKVRVYYNDTPQPVGIRVTGGNLPAQGIRISSAGNVGDTTRRVEIFQSYSEPPTIFDSAIFSMTDLVK